MIAGERNLRGRFEDFIAGALRKSPRTINELITVIKKLTQECHNPTQSNEANLVKYLLPLIEEK